MKRVTDFVKDNFTIRLQTWSDIAEECRRQLGQREAVLVTYIQFRPTLYFLRGGITGLKGADKYFGQEFPRRRAQARPMEAL